MTCLRFCHFNMIQLYAGFTEILPDFDYVEGIWLQTHIVLLCGVSGEFELFFCGFEVTLKLSTTK